MNIPDFLLFQLVVVGAGDGDAWLKGREMGMVTLKDVLNTSPSLGSASNCRLPLWTQSSVGIWH